MPIKTSGGLETVSVMLTSEQARRLRALREMRSSDHCRVSLSDVAREVVEAGLLKVSAPTVTVSTTNGTEPEPEAA